MPRKARASGSSPEKQTTTRRNTRRGRKVSEQAECEVANEIPAHLLRGSDESSEQSDNDSDYGSPKKGKGKAAATRGRIKKTKEIQEKPSAPTPRTRRGRRAREASPVATDEQNSQEDNIESANSQTTIDEQETSTMESTSDQPVLSEEKQEEQLEIIAAANEEPTFSSFQKSAAYEPEEKKDPQINIQENQQLSVANNKKVSDLTIEQDQINIDQATVNEEVVVANEHEENKSNDAAVVIAEKEKKSSTEIFDGDNEEEISKDAPDISMDIDQSDVSHVSNAPQNEKIELQRSRSSSGEIHESSRDAFVKENSPKKEQSPIFQKITPTEDEKKPLAATTTQRKRKWGARKNDEPVIAITTDSLANVIAEEVKPVPLSDVKLAISPSPEPEEKKPRVGLSSEDRDAKKKLLKERLRKQEEEEERRNEQIAKATERSQTSPTIVVTNGAGKDRKVSLVSNEEAVKASSSSSPPPPKNLCSKILCITNLVRPLTFLAVKSLVSRTGELDDFWIDSIKSKCFVKYKTEDEAIETRHALHGVKWPEHNLKTLNVEFSTDDEMNRVIDSTVGERIKLALAESRGEEESKTQEKNFGWSKSEISIDDRSVRVSRRVREWDVGKKEDLEHEERDRESREQRRRKSSERENRREKEERRKVLNESAIIGSGSPGTGREEKDAIPSQPGRLLDDLFRKSKAVPCIYWLPLSEEQIKEKEEQRQKNIAEHNRRMEEMIKNRELRHEKMIEERREREKRRQEKKDREKKSRSRSHRRYSRERRSISKDRDRRRYDRR